MQQRLLCEALSLKQSSVASHHFYSSGAGNPQLLPAKDLDGVATPELKPLYLLSYEPHPGVGLMSGSILRAFDVESSVAGTKARTR